jgi:hypothetical protein
MEKELKKATMICSAQTWGGQEIYKCGEQSVLIVMDPTDDDLPIMAEAGSEIEKLENGTYKIYDAECIAESDLKSDDIEIDDIEDQLQDEIDKFIINVLAHIGYYPEWMEEKIPEKVPISKS